MKTITFYVVAALCLLAAKLNGQTFERRARDISYNIAKISQEEKDSLKTEVEQVNVLLENDEISNEEADKRKLELAEKRAANIEQRVAQEREKLDELIEDRIEGNIEESANRFSISYEKGTSNDFPSDTVYTTYNYKRTTSQFVFAIGVNRLVEDGKVDDSNFEWRSDYYEWGVSFNTRLLQNNNLLHVKYGLSLQYNNLRPSNNKVFTTNGTGQTTLEYSGIENVDVSRFRYVSLVVPVHLEFDFTKKKSNGDKTYFPTHNSFRIGVGGYLGANVKEKQILKYDDQDGHKVFEKRKGDYNVNDFVYGVSAYVGYREVSLYAKYDLNPLFANNPIDQNSLALGIRFDIN